MRYRKRDLESYVYGLITGLGASGIVGIIYIRAVAELRFIGPQHQDYWWVTAITGTQDITYEWSMSVRGFTMWLMVLAFIAVLIGGVLGLSMIKERELQKSKP